MSETSPKEPTNAEMHVLQLLSAVEGTSVEELGNRLISAGEFAAIKKLEPRPSRFKILPSGSGR
jgi:hypothetical protein